MYVVSPKAYAPSARLLANAIGADYIRDTQVFERERYSQAPGISWGWVEGPLPWCVRQPAPSKTAMRELWQSAGIRVPLGGSFDKSNLVPQNFPVYIRTKHH